MRIGRSPSAEISLPSYKDLADIQAQIRVRKGEAVLSNLEPRLGVLVNEQKLQEERKMKLGDVIQIGSVKIFYKYE
jgi:pSer/pThr/pTyr-binding forkhead associated (FHA) protein